MTDFLKPSDQQAIFGQFPRELPILPLRNTVAFPFSILPLVIGLPRSIRLIEETVAGDRLVGLVASKDGSIEDPRPGQIHEIGTLARISRMTQGSEQGYNIVVQGLERFRVTHFTTQEPYLRAWCELAPDALEPGVEVDALTIGLRELAKEVVSLSPQLPDEVTGFLEQVKEPRYLTYLVAANAGLSTEEGQEILAADGLRGKLRMLIAFLARQKEILKLGQKIKSEAKEEMDKAQREYFLRQQLKAIRKELGESGEGESVIEEYREKLDQAKLPPEADREARRELKRMEGMAPHSSEYSVIKTYLDWLLDLPWHVLSEDQLDIPHARQVLDEDHYDLQEVKDRLLEYLAVRKLWRERAGTLDTQAGTEAGSEAETVPLDVTENEPAAGEESAPSSGTSSPSDHGNKPGQPGPGSGKPLGGEEGRGAILCFVGPPGVGKTSLGQSIARALGRPFTRMSLGGMRDEAEIRGHRRTYIGAMPGRIIQAIKRAGSRNPVFMLDEVDKIGQDWRGDPSSALLEALDPAQNHAFRDHYLDVDFDLGQVIFITTANQLEPIPAPLRDRMEIITLDGYTEDEKVRIAKGFLIARQVRANGLKPTEIDITDDTLRKIIREYTREAGVRNLERQISALCRKSAVGIASGEPGSVVITPDRVKKILKQGKYENETRESFDIPGIATGLAVTAAGGDILFIEAGRMKGKGGLNLTGQLGDVMKESAGIAWSWVRSKADTLGLGGEDFGGWDVHVHVPAGAIPKDGPSAGVAMVMAMVSLFTSRPISGEVGMTGEVTLRGRVLPVGGVKMKVLAAHRAGLKKVILPRRNEADLEELPQEVRDTMEFRLVDRIEEALEVLAGSTEDGWECRPLASVRTAGFAVG